MNILVLNGSPGGESGITVQPIFYMREFYPEHDYEILNVCQSIREIEEDFSSVKEKLEKADLIIFCYPRNALPESSHLHRLIELIKENNVPLAGKFATQVSASKHFDDTTAHELIWKNCAELGLKYIRGLSIELKYLITKKGRGEILNFFRNVLCAVDKDIPEKYPSMSIETVSLSDDPKPMIALTFDDGPSDNSASDRILDLLSEYNVHATFFMVGKCAKAHPDNVRRKMQLGHEIGSHTWDHEHGGYEIVRNDIVKGVRAIKMITGVAPSCFRSPYGTTKPHIRTVCKELGVPLYYWSIDTRDWESKDAQQVYKSVMDNVKDGDIVLMHEIYESTAQAVEMLLPALIERGYQLVTCRGLVIAKTGREPIPGEQYCCASVIDNDTD